MSHAEPDNENTAGPLQFGDDNTVQALHKEMFGPLYYFVYKLTNNLAEAQDIAASSFSKLLQKRDDFPNAAAMKSFLWITSRNAAYNYLTAKFRPQSLEGLAEPADSADTKEHEMVKAEIYAEIYQEIENLSPKFRSIVRLSYIEGKSNSEIASELGISSKTVRNSKSLAMKELKTILITKNLLSLTGTVLLLVKVLLSLFIS